MDFSSFCFSHQKKQLLTPYLALPCSQAQATLGLCLPKPGTASLFLQAFPARASLGPWKHRASVQVRQDQPPRAPA